MGGIHLPACPPHWPVPRICVPVGLSSPGTLPSTWHWVCALPVPVCLTWVEAPLDKNHRDTTSPGFGILLFNVYNISGNIHVFSHKDIGSQTVPCCDDLGRAGQQQRTHSQLHLFMSLGKWLASPSQLPGPLQGLPSPNRPESGPGSSTRCSDLGPSGHLLPEESPQSPEGLVSSVMGSSESRVLTCVRGSQGEPGPLILGQDVLILSKQDTIWF